MFERFVDCNASPYLLNTQYRMVPEISAFSNRHVYDGKIVDGRTSPKPHSFRKLAPSFQANSVLFMDITYGMDRFVHKSYENEEEAKIVASIAKKFISLDNSLTIGIISPYAPQK